MSFAKNNRITVGEKTEQNAPMTNQQKVDVAFSDDGTGTADYLIVDSYGYSGSAMILYHFTIHKGQPVVLVSLQNQGNPENMYYMYPTNNKDIQEAFANIVNGKWRFVGKSQAKVFVFNLKSWQQGFFLWKSILRRSSQ